jgi:hypothetical protein
VSDAVIFTTAFSEQVGAENSPNPVLKSLDGVQVGD